MADSGHRVAEAVRPASPPVVDDGRSDAAAKRRPAGWMARANITVEPVLLVHMLAFMLTSVVGNAFVVDRACRVHLSLPDRVCSNIEGAEFKSEAARVQVVVSTFHQYNSIVYNLVPVFLAPFLGAWSDRRGRKLLLLLGLVGNTFYFAMLTLVASQDTWPLEMILLLVSFPTALTGSSIAVFSATHSYVTDVHPLEDRTLRLVILDSSYMLAMPSGIALGTYLYTSVVNRSVAVMYGISATLIAVTAVYSLLVLHWRTNETQRPIKGVNIFCDFFDGKHLTESVKSIIKWRENRGRLYLLLIILCMSMNTFQRSESPMTYLFTQLKFNWNVNAFSNFRTFQTTTYVAAMLVVVPTFTKILGLKDAVIVLLASAAHIIARVFFITAEVPWVFYLGAGISSLGPTAPSVLRSMASKIVSQEERGKLFAMLCVVDAAIPMLAGVIYSQIYNVTLESYPPAIYCFTIGTQAALFLCMISVHISMKRSASVEVTTHHAE